MLRRYAEATVYVTAMALGWFGVLVVQSIVALLGFLNAADTSWRKIRGAT